MTVIHSLFARRLLLSVLLQQHKLNELLAKKWTEVEGGQLNPGVTPNGTVKLNEVMLVEKLKTFDVSLRFSIRSFFEANKEMNSNTLKTDILVPLLNYIHFQLDVRFEQDREDVKKWPTRCNVAVFYFVNYQILLYDVN